LSARHSNGIVGQQNVDAPTIERNVDTPTIEQNDALTISQDVGLQMSTRRQLRSLTPAQLRAKQKRTLFV
jgi:hypothetical protein